MRHERFNAALIASTLYNVNRLSAETAPLSAFDFLPGYETDPAEQEQAERRRQVKRAIGVAMSRLPDGATPEDVQDLKGKMIVRLKAQGFEDAVDLFREVYPDL